MRFSRLLALTGMTIALVVASSTGAQDKQPRIYVGGHWWSNLGRVYFAQKGFNVTGTLHFDKGGVATLQGNIKDLTLYFTWRVDAKVHGDGQITRRDDGRMSGPYTDKSTGKTGFFELRRVGETVGSEPLIYVGGKWKSNLGDVEFNQKGFKVTGTLRFEKGGLAFIDGTIKEKTLHFTWRVSDKVHGSGQVTRRDDGSMTGPYTDNSTGKTGYFALERVRSK